MGSHYDSTSFCYVWVLQLLWPVLLFWLGFAVYRSLRLPSLPWLAAFYGFRLIVSPAVAVFLRRSDRLSVDPFFPFADPSTSYLVLAIVSISALIHLLVVLLISSDVAFLISKGYPNIQSRLLRFFLQTRRHVTSLGAALIILTALAPTLTIVFHFVRSTSSTR
jgi:hypothetical protein